jgi:hypothetical protein
MPQVERMFEINARNGKIGTGGEKPSPDMKPVVS